MKKIILKRDSGTVVKHPRSKSWQGHKMYKVVTIKGEAKRPNERFQIQPSQ